MSKFSRKGWLIVATQRDALLLHDLFADMRRRQEAYQRGGNRVGPHAAQICARVESAAYRASHLWRQLAPDVSALLADGIVLDRSEFRTAKAMLGMQPTSRLAGELRKLAYPDQFLPGLVIGAPLEAAEYSAFVEQWHRFGMDTIDASVDLSRSASDGVRRTLYLFQGSAFSSAFLGSSLLLTDEPLLVNIVKTTLRTPPSVALTAAA